GAPRWRWAWRTAATSAGSTRSSSRRPSCRSPSTRPALFLRHTFPSFSSACVSSSNRLSRASAAGARRALERAERVEEAPGDPPQQAGIFGAERVVGPEAQLAEDQAADDGRPGEIDRAGPLHRALQGVLPGDRGARGPGEGRKRRSSALPRAQVDLGPEQAVPDDVDGPRIAVGLEQRTVAAKDRRSGHGLAQ